MNPNPAPCLIDALEAFCPRGANEAFRVRTTDHDELTVVVIGWSPMHNDSVVLSGGDTVTRWLDAAESIASAFGWRRILREGNRLVLVPWDSDRKEPPPAVLRGHVLPWEAGS
jgi:hypothetical protein